MAEWFKLMERGLDLAKLVKKDKDYPWKGASNVKYPLITSAALQFNARAYPAIVPEDRPVKVKVWGNDKGGLKAARADRLSEHMSWQLQAQVTEWDKETDKLLVQLPIVGEMFRKWWYDPVLERARCRLIEPGKFIVNDAVKNLDDAPRCSEEIQLYPYEIETRARSDQFIEFEYDSTGDDDQKPVEFIEHHCRIDLDEDGYEEPYIATVHVDTKQVVRLVADFEESDVVYRTEQQMVPAQVPLQGVKDIYGQQMMINSIVPQAIPVEIQSIRRGTYFADFQFLPGIDGGFHGTGLGLLLGDISDSINTIMNMLLDAGHYASLGGGFIGSDFRMRGGNQNFRPGEWKKVAATGSTVRESVVPMTFPGPDQTLFTMLGMLIDAGREIASVKDVMTGEQPRQQQTATTTIALIEQGMMVFTAAYKRIFRSCKSEYKMLAKINQGTVDLQSYNAFFDGEEEFDPAADYNADDMDVQPVADPRSVTKMQKAAKASFVMQLADQGLVDKGEAMKRIAEAMDVEDVEDLMPKPDPMQQAMSQLQMRAAQADVVTKQANIELIMAKVEEARTAAVENMSNARSDEVRAENEVIKTRLEAMKEGLNHEREVLRSLIEATRGMEGAPGNNQVARGYSPPVGIPEAGDVFGMVPRPENTGF